MVRFHWHVEDGFGCMVPPGKLDCWHQDGILHAGIEFEIAGQSGLVEALITCPLSYLEGTKDVGVALAHEMDADGWKGELMTSLAVCLAKEGHVVVRYYCKQKEQRRQRIFEKALDACATSPFARHVTRWALGGVGNGSRVAAAVGTRCRGSLAGFMLMGYPLQEPLPSNKGGPAPDSRGPLLRLEAPILFVIASHDKNCSLADLEKMEPNMPSRDKRFIRMQDLNQDFRTLSDNSLLPSTILDLCSVCLEYMSVVSSKDFSSCAIPHLNSLGSNAKVQATTSTAQLLEKASSQQEQHIPPQTRPAMPPNMSCESIPPQPTPVEAQLPCSILSALASAQNSCQMPQEYQCEVVQPLSSSSKPVELDSLKPEPSKSSDEDTCMMEWKANGEKLVDSGDQSCRSPRDAQGSTMSNGRAPRGEELNRELCSKDELDIEVKT